MQVRLNMLFQRPSQPPANTPGLGEVDDKPGESFVLRWLQCGRRPGEVASCVGMNGSLAQKRSRRDRKTSEGQPHVRFVFYVGPVIPGELLVVHIVRRARIHLVVHYRQVSIQNHAEESVTSQ